MVVDVDVVLDVVVEEEDVVEVLVVVEIEVVDVELELLVDMDVVLVDVLVMVEVTTLLVGVDVELVGGTLVDVVVVVPRGGSQVQPSGSKTLHTCPAGQSASPHCAASVLPLQGRIPGTHSQGLSSPGLITRLHTSPSGQDPLHDGAPVSAHALGRVVDVVVVPMGGSHVHPFGASALQTYPSGHAAWPHCSAVERSLHGISPGTHSQGCSSPGRGTRLHTSPIGHAPLHMKAPASPQGCSVLVVVEDVVDVVVAIGEMHPQLSPSKVTEQMSPGGQTATAHASRSRSSLHGSTPGMHSHDGVGPAIALHT